MYKTLALSTTISFFVMYAVMFFNVAEFNHVYNSLMRLYMTVLMITPMILIMMGTMRSMFKDTRLNTIIIFATVLVFVLSFFGMRTQTAIGDEQWLKAMIPHHSSAILTSDNANLSDPEVQELAEEIIEAQEREITLMKEILKEKEND